MAVVKGNFYEQTEKEEKGCGKNCFSLSFDRGMSGDSCRAGQGKFPEKAITDGVKSAVTEKVTEKVMEQVVQKALESSGNPQAAAKAKEIVGNMEEADKQEAEAILEKYADSETLSDCMEIVGDGINSETVTQVQEYLQERVADEDIQKLQELYEKYGSYMQ